MSSAKFLIGAALGASVIGLSTLSASADVVCVGPVCWHAHERYEYPPSAGVTVHEDAWKPGPDVDSASTRGAAIGTGIAGRHGDRRARKTKGRRNGAFLITATL